MVSLHLIWTGYSQPGLYLGLKRPRIDYTRVYYGLGQFIPKIPQSRCPIRLFCSKEAQLYMDWLDPTLCTCAHDMWNRLRLLLWPEGVCIISLGYIIFRGINWPR